MTRMDKFAWNDGFIIFDKTRKGQSRKGKFVTIDGRPVFVGGPSQGAGSTSPGSTSKTFEEVLETSPYTIVEDESAYEKGQFESHLVELDEDGNAILKPAEPPWPGQEPFDMANAEASAYDVAEMMGYEGMIPPTVTRHAEGKNSSVQAWVHDATEGYKHTKENVPDEQVKQMIIFDAFIGNNDRHGGNFLITDDNSLVGIDHGLSFSSVTQVNTFQQFARWMPKEQIARLEFTSSDFQPIFNVLSNKRFMSQLEQRIGSARTRAFEQRGLELYANGLNL